MIGRRALCLFGVALCAALGAALLAHVAIDAAGDYLLPHDSYDDVAHGSRGLVGGTLLALLLATSAVASRAVLRRARGSERALCTALQALRPRNAVLFAGTVVALALPFLIGMEGLDVISAGGRIDDVGDLLGGSPILGLALAGLCAVACAWITRVTLGRLAAFGRAVARAVRFLRRALGGGAARPLRLRRPFRARATVRCVVRRLAGRAPPPQLLGPVA